MGCLTCDASNTGAGTCTKCAPGLSLGAGGSSYLGYTGYCGTCADENCVTCGIFDTPGTCLGCAAGYYPDSDTHLCVKCPDGTNSFDNNDWFEGCRRKNLSSDLILIFD